MRQTAGRGSSTMYGVFFVLCILGTQGKPSLSLNLPAAFAVFGGFGGAPPDDNTAAAAAVNRDTRDTATMANGGGGGGGGVTTAAGGANGMLLKKYSGKRIANDSLRMVYFHDQTVAVVELGAKKLLLNCELIEVYEPEDAIKALGDLQMIARPVAINFKEMMTLMTQCQQVDSNLRTTASQRSTDGQQTRSPVGTARGLLANNPFVLLSGIIPGTKWCGTGDIASDYHDLGAEPLVDRCCRAHDLCPVKVRAYSQRYNLTNGSLYTKSHCGCDDNLYDCLKISDSPTGHIMGHVYFNLIQVPCVQDTNTGARKFRSARSNF